MEFKKDFAKKFKKAFESLRYRYGKHDLFSDFVHLSVLEISQVTRMQLGWGKDPADEAEYMKIVSRYEPDVVRGPIKTMFGQMQQGIEQEGGDWLGSVFNELELYNDRAGQFFTPYHVALLMARLVCEPDNVRETIRREGWCSMNEPTCGAGSMAIAQAEVFRNLGFDVATELFVTAQDISFVAAGMCYIQLSLLGIPALVLNMDSLWPQKGVHWGRFTPCALYGGWPLRLQEKKDREASTPETGIEERKQAVAAVRKPGSPGKKKGGDRQLLLFDDSAS